MSRIKNKGSHITANRGLEQGKEQGVTHHLPQILSRVNNKGSHITANRGLEQGKEQGVTHHLPQALSRVKNTWSTVKNKFQNPLSLTYFLQE
jgi:hypothetical protein